MQPTTDTLAENVRTQSFDLLNRRPAAAIHLDCEINQAHGNVRRPDFTAIHEPSDKSGPRQVTAPYYPDLPSESFDGDSSASKLNDRTEIWENEGGAGRAGEPKKALRVLVVEDNALIGILLAEMLEKMGYDVCATEATEADAVAAAARHQPDLMVVDAWLREGSGVSAVEQILRTGFVPHVFVSGDMSMLQVARPGAVAIQKPFREAELARAIRRALDVDASNMMGNPSGRAPLQG